MIDFKEFIVAYALTSRGDLKTKLDYAFDCYDADENGSLTGLEVRAVIHGMLDMLVSISQILGIFRQKRLNFFIQREQIKKVMTKKR